MEDTTKKPLPEMDMSVFDEVEVGRPWVVMSWPTETATPAEALLPTPFSALRNVWNAAVAFL